MHSHICCCLPDNTSHDCSVTPPLAYHHAALFLNITPLSARFLLGWHRAHLTSSLVTIGFQIFRPLSRIHASSETLYLPPKGVISVQCQSREKFPGLPQQLLFEAKCERLAGLNRAQSHNHLHEGPTIQPYVLVLFTYRYFLKVWFVSFAWNACISPPCLDVTVRKWGKCKQPAAWL